MNVLEALRSLCYENEEFDSYEDVPLYANFKEKYRGKMRSESEALDFENDLYLVEVIIKDAGFKAGVRIGMALACECMKDWDNE